MLKRLNIVNFRGIRSLSADLDAVTAFLGPNSSGKTTALHAIRVACELLQRAIDSDYPARVEEFEAEPWVVVTQDTLMTDGSGLLSLADWQALFVDQNVGGGVRFQIDLVFDEGDPVQAVWVQVTCARNDQLKLAVFVRASEAVARVVGLPKKSPLINRTLTEYLREHSPRAVLIPPFYGTVPAEELRSRAIIDRLLGSGDQSHVVRNLVAGLSSDQFLQLSRFLEDTLGARLISRTSGDLLQSEPTLRVTFADSNGELEISAAGAGLVNLVALYAALSRWSAEAARRRLLFLLDEPEAHLSPRVQANSAERLARLVTRDFSGQLLLATHSVDILNRLSETGARLLRVDRTATPSVTTLESDASLFDDLAGWADLTPYTAINFLASRRVLFVEGRDELAVLPKLGELRFRNDLTRLRRFRQWAVVQLEGVRQEGVAGLLGRLLRNDAIRAQAEAAPFEILVALDRDYERQPGWSEPAAEGAIAITRFVWSLHSLESLLATVSVLPRWVRAYLGDEAPQDLEAVIQAALDEADRDPTLLAGAVSRYTASIVLASNRDGAAPLANNAAVVREASEQAQRSVLASPRVWQHGKSRAQFVLRRVREGLSPAARGHFPVDVVRLVERVDINQIGTVQDAIPPEVNDLLERMARP